MRRWLLCFILIIAGCTTTNSAVQPTLRGPVVPTRVIPTFTPTATPTDTPVPTSTPTVTDTPEPTSTNTPVPPTDTPTPTNTPEPTNTNTPVPPTDTPTVTDTPEPTRTNTPAPPTNTPPATDTPEATSTLALPTEMPTAATTPVETVPYRNSTSLGEAPIYGALTLDTVYSGVIDDEHTAALYTFEGTAGMVVDVELRAVEGDLDPFLLVLDPKGREIARNDDYYDGTGDSAILPLTLPETGTYVIVATRYLQDFGESSGHYDLAITQVDPLSDPSGTFSQPISYDSQVTGTLDDNLPEQLYTFRATAGDVISVQMTHTSGDLDPRIALTNNLGTEIFSNDDNMVSGTVDAAIQRYIIPKSGYYAIVAQRYSGATSAGDYRLKLVREAQNAAGLYAMLDLVNSTTINDEGALYYFTYSAGDKVDDNNEEHAFQTLLTFRLPPNESQPVESAIFALEPCLENGGGYATLGALTVYQDNYGRLSEARNVTRPLPGSRVLSTQNTCASVDLTSIVQNAYANGERDIQLRLIFRDNTDNGETDEVYFTPSLLVTLGS